MSAVVDRAGKLRPLDATPEPEERITEEEAGDAGRLARLLMRILRDVATLRRRWWPQHVDHRDRLVDNSGTTLHRFPHGFGGRVNWWTIDWTGSSSQVRLIRSAASDDNTLVLVSLTIGTVSIRIEEAG